MAKNMSIVVEVDCDVGDRESLCGSDTFFECSLLKSDQSKTGSEHKSIELCKCIFCLKFVGSFCG